MTSASRNADSRSIDRVEALRTRGQPASVIRADNVKNRARLLHALADLMNGVIARRRFTVQMRRYRAATLLWRDAGVLLRWTRSIVSETAFVG